MDQPSPNPLPVPPPPAAPDTESDSQVFASAVESFLMDLGEERLDDAFSNLLLQRLAVKKLSTATDAPQPGLYSYEDSCLLVQMNEEKMCLSLLKKVQVLGAKATQATAGPPSPARRGGRGGGRGGSAGGRSGASGGGRGGASGGGRGGVSGGGRGRGGSNVSGRHGLASPATTNPTNEAVDNNPPAATQDQPNPDPSSLLHQVYECCDLLHMICLESTNKNTFSMFFDALTVFGDIYSVKLNADCSRVVSSLKKQRIFRNKTSKTIGGVVDTTEEQENIYQQSLSAILGEIYTPLTSVSKFFYDIEPDNDDVPSGDRALSLEKNRKIFSLVKTLDDLTCTYLVKVLDAFLVDNHVEQWGERANKNDSRVKRTARRQRPNSSGGRPASSGSSPAPPTDADGSDAVKYPPLNDEDSKRLGTVLKEVAEIIRLSKEYSKWTTEMFPYHILSESGTNKPILSEEYEYKIDHMTSLYITMETFWFYYNANKAITSNRTTDHGFGYTVKVYSMVENTFYVVKMLSFNRARYTTVGYVISALATGVFCEFLANTQYGYSAAIQNLIRQQSRLMHHPEEEDDDEEDGGGKQLFKVEDKEEVARRERLERQKAFDALFEQELNGVAMLNRGLLYAVNSAELSVLYLSELSREIHDTFAYQFPEIFQSIGMALDSLKTIAYDHEHLRVAALSEIVEFCIASSLKNAIEAQVKHVSFEPTHAMFEKYQSHDPFMKNFIHNNLVNNNTLQMCRQALSVKNFAVVVVETAKHVTNALEQEWANKQVNELGAMLMDSDVQLLLDYLSGLVAPKDDEDGAHGDGRAGDLHNEDALLVRKEFARLKQWTTLVGLYSPSDVEQFQYPLKPVLTEKQVRKVLLLRFPQEEQLVYQVDVSKHCCADEQVPGAQQS